MNFNKAQRPFVWSLGKGGKPLTLFCRGKNNIIFSMLKPIN